MKKLLEIGLGIMAALGGFVDIGDLVFASQAGAKFGLRLLWALALGTLLIIIYAEMSGRVATVSKQGVFDIIRRIYPRKLGLVALAGSTLVNLITCAAEIGGIALVLQLLSGLPYTPLIFAALLALILIIWVLPFSFIEKLFGYFGLGLLTLFVAALKTHPQLGQIGHGLLPQVVNPDWTIYAYFAVGIIAATLMPYEVYFYAAGAIEEKWKPKDLIINKINSILGFILGGMLVGGIIIASAHFFGPLGIDPQFINTPALTALIPFGQAGLLLVLLGMLFSIGGSAVETSFASAYSISQYFRWDWGKRLKPLEVPRFTAAWLLMLIAAFLIIVTGFDPITMTEYAVIFSVVVMPLTYYPIMMAAQDDKIMGKHVNKRWNTVLGWVAFAFVVIVSLLAVPLMLFTQRGQV